MTIFGIDCSKTQGFIGTEPCAVDPGPLLGHIVLPDRATFDVATTVPNKAFFNNLVQQGKAYFITNAFSAPVETGDPTVETSESTQRQVVVNRALPMVTQTMKSSYEAHTQLYPLSSQDQYSVIHVYQNALKVTISKDELAFGGVNVGMYEVLTYEDATGSTKAQTRIRYQITDLDGYNTRGRYLTGLDFDPNTEINNIVAAKLIGTADVADNKVLVKVVWGANQSYNINGLAAANFKLAIDGVDNAISGVVSRNANMQWEITPTATLAGGEEIEVIMYDAAATPAVAVAKVGTNNPKFYAGTTGVFVAETPST